LDLDDYEALLIVAGLAYNTRFGFAIESLAWREFLGGHRFAIDHTAIEFDKKQIDLDAYINGTAPSQSKRRRFYVVRIGNKTERSPNKIEEQMGQDGRLITTPPRLNGIGIKTQSFRRIVEPFIWNYLVENDMDSKDESLSSLSSLLTTTRITSLSSLPPPAPANKKRKFNEGTSNEVVSSNDDYPHLSRALGKEDGFNPTDPTIQKTMRALLAELIDLLSTDYELNVIDSANNSVTYV